MSSKLNPFAIALASVALFASSAVAEIGKPQFDNSPIGDLDGDGRITQRDVDALTAYVFDGQKPPCKSLESLDINGDGRIDITDAAELAEMAYAKKKPKSRRVSFMRGDVNGDRKVDISDLTALIHVLTGGGAAANSVNAADVNGDQQVDVADLDALTRYLFSR